MIEVKRCPFCGSSYLEIDKGFRQIKETVGTDRVESYGLWVWIVTCKTCQACGPYEHTLIDAIRLWNDRTLDKTGDS